MTHLDDQGRPEPPELADEVATLRGYLEFQRATFDWKCGGVSAEGLALSVGVSAMTLGGLLKHMAYVEDHWFSRYLHGNAAHPPWDTVDWNAHPDWEWVTAVEDTPEQLMAMWQEAVARSRVLLDEALSGGGLGQTAKRRHDDKEISLRWILVHMIEEYARHNGHADLIREVYDGQTGE